MDKLIVTIDGPSGSGKSTLAKLLACREGFFYIDTGALYRSIAYLFSTKPTPRELDKLSVLWKKVNTEYHLFVSNRDMEPYIRGEEIGKNASIIAKLPFVRRFVNSVVRENVNRGKYVVEGRDVGSVIFPEAQVKIYLQADLKERAMRRAKELHVQKDMILDKIKERDEKDITRKDSPLVIPEGAHVIDTTNKTQEKVYTEVISLLK
ncbi:MAG: (d)CMP kinase [Deltaproteobacteria bacterium]|nr:(d)CMP kinase [Deltaproteobacteria bacterium]